MTMSSAGAPSIPSSRSIGSRSTSHARAFSGNLSPGLNWRLRRERDHALWHFRLNLAKVLNESLKATIFIQHGLTDFVELLDDGIFDHDHGSMSSCGVQMRGGSNPLARQTA